MLRRSFLLFTIYLFTAAAFAQTAPSQGPAGKPKLVVGLVIDQMRWDYLYRYRDLYGAGGFKRLLSQGFSCENTMIPYTATVTAAGHTCIYTGSVPAIHGIVANDWIDQETGIFMYCAKDTTVMPVGSTSVKEGQMSPRNMLSNTVGDELRLATNFRSKVIGIALKDRGGIMPAGHSANAAYWFDNKTGGWITSTYYTNELPGWVKQYNNRRVPDSLMKNDWTLLYDKSKYIQSTEDDMPFEKILESDKGRVFPHKYQSVIGSSNYDPFRSSPYGATYTLQFAEEAIRNEKLGMGTATDMLCVSISSTDYIGHRFGPNALETEDTYLRLDRDIASFLTYLDKTLGKNNYLLFLSADHGAPQIGNYLKQEKKYFTAGALNSNTVVKNLNKLCLDKFGADGLVKKVYDYQLYLDHAKVDAASIDRKALKIFIVENLKMLPEVWNAYDVDNFSQVIMPAVLREKISNSYYFRRSGDVQYFYKAQYTDFTDSGIEHGAWYPYDSHIPLVWFGWNIKPGKLNRETYMTDIAPTLAAMLQIQMPNGCVGKVITELIK
jgi:predicted AlkP superfamily pyrophosphatase or phosphodiesterase